jgi:hypothetical protein
VAIKTALYLPWYWIGWRWLRQWRNMIIVKRYMTGWILIGLVFELPNYMGGGGMPVHRIFTGGEPTVLFWIPNILFYSFLLWIEWSFFEGSINAVGYCDEWSFVGAYPRSRVWRATGMALTALSDGIYHRLLY